jgi:acyl carrier protein
MHKRSMCQSSSGDPVIELVKSLVVEASGGELARSSLEPDSDLERDCHLDSLDVIDIVTSLEEKCGFRLGPNEPSDSDLRTIGTLALFCARRSGNVPAPPDGAP